MNLIFPFNEGFTMFCKNNCWQCDEAKKMVMERTNDKLNIIDCDDILNNKTLKEEFIEHIEELIEQKFKKFPIIFKDGIFIGGQPELWILYFDKKL
jgi:hypothetical protein